ncbi:hypothetical protein [Bacillus rhizoplanae]|uniref:hypothetical protein n=1 Tax=Bacillus rhizoplanae TaxID=2880966 RepID=UPI003D1E44E9
MKQLAKCKISVSEGQELILHIAEVKRGHNTYYFEINKAIDYISVYFIDGAKRRFSIASAEEMLTMIPNEIERKRYRNIIGDASWLLLDGIHDFRSMTKEEQAAFLYLKEQVLDEMAASLEGMMV